MFHTKKYFLTYSFLTCLCFFILLEISSVLYADGEDFWLYSDYLESPVVRFGFDKAGYSDGWYWGLSDRHNWHPTDESQSHEMLTGEWAAALYFTGIQNNKAQWLTRDFHVPNWDTDRVFNEISGSASDNPNNPINGHDTAQSIVEIPNKIRVTMDYSLIDLGTNYASLPFRNYSGNIKDVNSERYILIQRYTIMNTSGSTISGLEFYQMLHSHPAAKDYPPFAFAVNSTYTDVELPHTLTGYDPCNLTKPFKYAITQWNYDTGNTGHVDWGSFSSTIKPDWIDNETYKGRGGKPLYGTHVNIENRAINGSKSIYFIEAAGAMGWKLPDLESNKYTSITFAVMFGSGKPLLYDGNPGTHNVWNKTKGGAAYYATISDAVSAADSGDTIIVYPGVYKENVNFDSKKINLQSSDPNNPFIVNHTVILGDGSNNAITVDKDSKIDGLTIVYGYSGIYCYTANLTVSCCNIRSSAYAGINCYQGSVNDPNTLTVNRCRIENNYNGIYQSGGGNLQVNETFVNNNSGTYGGIFYNGQYGGKAVITDSIIHNNNSKGIYLYYCSSPAEIRNNTIVSNNYGIYGLSSVAPYMNSNIIYNNTFNLSGISGVGKYNRFFDPHFINANAGDYHLKSDSNCINDGNTYFSSSTELDIDGEARINDANVDIGADEFYSCTSRDVFPAPPDGPDGIVNFQDFVVLANAWMTNSGDSNYNDIIDFNDNGHINYKDLKEFCNCWLYTTANYESRVESDSMMSMPLEEQSISENVFASDEQMAESQQEQSEESQQQDYMPDYNLPAIYLTCDNNTPEPNDEVTIQVHSVAPLFGMGLGIYISGDANITTAMSEADCNSFGWDNDWNSDPDIEDGWVYLTGVSWLSDVNGTVGYVKFRYHSGQVSVYIDQENSLAIKWNDDESCSYVPFSQDVLYISRDPNGP